MTSIYNKWIVIHRGRCNTVDFSLNCRACDEKIICKTLKLFSFVNRTSSEFNLSNSLKTLYYATVYNNYKLEWVQFKFLKYVAFVMNEDCLPHDYSPKLQSLNLTTLSMRERRLI